MRLRGGHGLIRQYFFILLTCSELAWMCIDAINQTLVFTLASINLTTPSATFVQKSYIYEPFASKLAHSSNLDGCPRPT